MKLYRFIWLTFLFSLALLPPVAAKNVFEQILGVYQKYQEVNMTLWLVGDVGAEKRLGKELQMWMSLTNKEEKDPKINAYVKGIFNRLVPHYNNRGMKFDLKVIKNSAANAFVIPGGHVYVQTGLLNLAQSDDELAAVIAHELGHAERRHSLANFRTSTVAVAILNKAVKNKRDRETWGALLGYLALMKFSRQQEDEADDIGQFRMAKAGFNPAAQVTLWEKFLTKFGDTKGVEQYLSSHPPSSARIQNAKNNLKKMNVTERSVFSNTRNILTNDKVNLFKNPGFEEPLAPTGHIPNWEIVEGAAAVVENNSLTGRRSLQLSAEKRLSVTRVLSDFIPVNENSDFNFSGWCRSENGQQSVAIGIELYDNNRRLRNRIWAIRESSPTAAAWNEVEARLYNTKDKKIFAANISYVRLLLQTGMTSSGAVWFDELRLRPSSAVDPVNLLHGGDFEMLTGNALPVSINTNKDKVVLDYAKANSGYASIKVQGSDSPESGFSFAPIALDKFKAGQNLTCSFYFQGDRQQKGLVIVELVDGSGKPLPRRLAQVEFEAQPGNWQATSFSFQYQLQNEETAHAKAVQVKVVASLTTGVNLWFDTFIMR